MSRAQDQISMPKDLPVKYSGIMEFAALPARQRQARALVRDVRRARILVCAFYLPSQGCCHRNANYFGKDLWKRQGSRSKTNSTLECQFTKSGDRHRSCCSRIPTEPRTRIRPDPAFSNGRISHVSGLVAFDAAQKIPGGNGEYVTSNDCSCCCDLDVVFSVIGVLSSSNSQHKR